MGCKKHDYHILDPSPWPLWASFCVFFLTTVSVCYMHGVPFGAHMVILGAVMLVSSALLWWADVIKEATIDRAHNDTVRRGLSIGMLLFILSELMFFFAFFWSFFTAWLSPLQVFQDWETLKNSWPPEGITVLDPWSIPYINTLILLLSGTTVTWAHHEVLSGNNQKAHKALGYTVLLGFAFISLQMFEYWHTDFSFVQEDLKSIYTSNFYMITGFHGFHVFIGLIFLIVCWFRSKKDHFSPQQHVGMEFAAWYWHFVDVVWIFLFVFLYWMSGKG